MMKQTPFMRSRLAAAGFLVLAAGCVSAPASGEPAKPEGLQHVENGKTFSVADRFGADPVEYAVHWDRYVLETDAAGTPTTISGTAYLRACECDPAARPVMFLFNGGPGASSSPLHFALGPARRERGEEATSFPENPDTILRMADLVFIDPVETGLSRAASPDGESRFLGVEGDVEAVGAFIHEWLDAHDRSDAPVFVTGQSYGGYRLANLAADLGGLDVEGLIMVSPALDMGAGAGDAGHVFALPTMAATAWRFGKSSLEADGEAEAWEQARAFAETDYLVALQRGDLLADDERQQIASRVAAMTGLPVGLVLDSNLRVDIQDFLENVLAEENLLVSRLNTAVTQEKRPPANPDRPDGANDPSLGLGRSNKIISEDIGAYLQEKTGLETEEGYRSLNLDANFAWDWRPASKRPRFTFDAAPKVRSFMQDNDDVRLLVFGGYRDLAVTALQTQYALTHAGLPQARVHYEKMLSGHSPFDEDALREPFTRTIHDFMLAALGDDAAEAEKSE